MKRLSFSRKYRSGASASTAGQYRWEYSNERLDGNFIKNDKLEQQADEVLKFFGDKEKKEEYE